MRSWLAVCALSSVACGSVTNDETTCEPLEWEHEKSWFIGGLADQEDNPFFTLTIDVIAVDSPIELEPAFGDASTSYDVKFEVTESLLIARTIDKRLPAVYAIRSHNNPCDPPYNPDLNHSQGGSLPWPERPLMRVDWSLNLSEQPFRFDTAALAGDPEAVSYTPIAFAPDAWKLELAADRLVVMGKHWLEWEDPASCEHDFPGLAPDASCPPASATLRYEFVRQP